MTVCAMNFHLYQLLFHLYRQSLGKYVIENSGFTELECRVLPFAKNDLAAQPIVWIRVPIKYVWHRDIAPPSLQLRMKS